MGGVKIKKSLLDDSGDVEIEVKNKVLSNNDNLRLISEGNNEDLAKALQNVDKTKVINKLFLLQQAENAQKTVIKWLDFMDEVQDEYLLRAKEIMSMGLATPYDLSQMLLVIQSCIEKSNNFIKTVTDDDGVSKLSTIQLSDNCLEYNFKSVEEDNILNSVRGRGLVREAIELSMLEAKKLRSSAEDSNTETK